MRLAVRQGLLSSVPAFTLLRESSPRAGFFERDAFEAVCRHLPEDLQLALRVEHAYGWRMQSEVLTRQWPHLDLGTGTLRLDAGESKNDDARIVYLTPELLDGFRAQRARVEALQRAARAGDPARVSSSRRRSAPRGATARLPAGVDDGMSASGAARDVAPRPPAYGGAKPRERWRVGDDRDEGDRPPHTRGFDRYNIVSPSDLQNATAKLVAAGRPGEKPGELDGAQRRK